jgi:hypothetical protein
MHRLAEAIVVGKPVVTVFRATRAVTTMIALVAVYRLPG